MGQVDRFDQQLHDEIEDLVSEGLIERDSVPYGVAQQVIGQGYDSLSGKQRSVYDLEVAPALKKRAEQLEMQRRMGSDES